MEQKTKKIKTARLTADERRAEWAAKYEGTLSHYKEGAIVEGQIISICGPLVIVDIGYKSEGLLPVGEFRDVNSVTPGDKVEVLIQCLEDDNGMVVLSKELAEQQRNWDKVLSQFVEGGIIEGRVVGKVKGGLVVDVGVEAFLPGSQIDTAPVKNLDDYLGKTFEFKVIKINKDRRNIVVSRRELLEDVRRSQRRHLLEEIKVGQTRRGVVKNITDFGAFIDLNGMDGLLHITDMSWGRINHPSELLQVGNEVEVVVLDVNLEKERISLGLKQKTANPWEGLAERYPIGSRIRGRVVNLMPYGAFVEIEEGVEGLVHVSELSWTKRIAKASDVLKIGDVVDAVILNINETEKKISLGIRQTETNPWDLVSERYPIGSRVKGKVRNFTSYGAFVELQEGIDGMIHVSDMSWSRKVNHPSEVLKKGDMVECVVLEVDSANQRISLGLKQAQEDPWSAVAAKYRVGSLIKGKVSKLASFGAFVSIEDGVDGLVHISQISDDRVQNVSDVLAIGQDVEARVVKIDPVERRIGLSIKAAKLPDSEFVVDEEMLQGLQPGEDLVNLAGAFDQAISNSGAKQEEWHPGG